MPKVSVLLPVYNGEKYLRESIESALVQSFSDMEILVINDGSADNSLSIAKNIASSESRIKIIDLPKNVGLPAALNIGLESAVGEYIARLDADDIWFEQKKIQTQVDFLDRHPDYALVGTSAEVINEAGETVGDIHYPADDEMIRKNILVKNLFIHSSVMFRRDAALACRGYNPAEKYVEDYGLWLRMGATHKFTNLSLRGVRYRLNPRGETATKNRRQVTNSFRLVFRFRKKYPNFCVACIKWLLRLAQTFV